MTSHHRFVARAMPIAPQRCKVAGSVLIEALVSLGVFTAGILGVMTLQAKMVASTSSAKYRADAAFLASEVVGVMWGDVANLGKYDASQCATYVRCSAWTAKVASYLPQGSATLSVNNGLVTVTVSWKPANAPTSSYTAATSVRL
jgi:type IV pilus assembly protein PilV